MAEQEQRITHFDAQTMGDLLGTPSTPTRDVAYGEGRTFPVGPGDGRLDVFPGDRVTTYTARDVRIELFGHAVTEVSPTNVELRRDEPDREASITKLPDGSVLFTLFVFGEEHTPAERSQPVEPDAPQLAAGGSTSTPPETSTEFIARDAKRRDDVAAAQALLNCPPAYLTRIGVSEQAIDEARSLVEAEEPPTARQERPATRVPARTPEEPRETAATPLGTRAPRSARRGSRSQPAASERTNTRGGSTEGRERPIPAITGHIGNTRPNDPSHETFSFYTTPKGTDVGRFHLVVPHPGSPTDTWHLIQVYGDQARSLQQRVNDGELSAQSPVVAHGCYPKTYQTTENGKTKTVKYVNAVRVDSAPPPQGRGLAGKPS